MTTFDERKFLIALHTKNGHIVRNPKINELFKIEMNTIIRRKRSMNTNRVPFCRSDEWKCLLHLSDALESADPHNSNQNSNRFMNNSSQFNQNIS